MKFSVTDDEDKVHIISPVQRESPFRFPVKKRKVGTQQTIRRRENVVTSPFKWYLIC
jgi:hypothetical protein